VAGGGSGVAVVVDDLRASACACGSAGGVVDGGHRCGGARAAARGG